MLHIKSLDKGAFTNYCKRKGFTGVTCECIKQGKNSTDYHVRQMANFAYNFGFKNHGKTCEEVEQQTHK
jgi:hypothetical protein